MKKVGIVVDSWKRNTFRKHLDESKFKYEEHTGPGSDVHTFIVECDNILPLKLVIEAASQACLN